MDNGGIDRASTEGASAHARPTRRIQMCSLWHRVFHAYEAVQVELRGSYSVERMCRLNAFASSHHLAWCAFVVAVTPLPCIAVVVLVDAVPLHPPSLGLAYSHSFWWRVALVSSCITFTLLEQLRVFVPRLSATSTLTILWLSIVIGIGCGAYGLLMASLVGYPLPFTLFFGSPSWQLLFWSGIICTWGRELRRDRALRSDVIAFYKVVVLQLSLTAIYPAYNHVFTQLDGLPQAAFALGLPVLKILAKNAFRQVFCLAEDFVPEVVIFNVEIFHALFVSTCMQNATSLSTTAVIMLADGIQAWLHIMDIDGILRRLQLFESKRSASRQSIGIANANATNSHANNITTTTSVSPLMSALLCVAIDRSLQSDPSIRLRAMPCPPPSPTHRRLAAVHPIEQCTNPPTEGAVLQTLHLLTHACAPTERDVLQHALTSDERRAYVATVLRVLHYTEFLVLIEFVEVAVPLVYCAYLIAIAHMPNRAFYPQLARMDASVLRSTIGSIVVYTLLELGSFIALCVVLERKLRVSPVRQLAFVLHNQWKLVQSKMVLWVVVIIGTSLEQFGYDYTFQFAWLKSRPSSR